MAEVRGVLDSSLLATALVSSRGPGNALLDAARLDRFVLIVSPEILEEVRRALMDAFEVSPGDAEYLVGLVERIAEVRSPLGVEPLSRDETDDHVLALAEETGALFLATYDHDLMAAGSVGICGVVHPATALQLVRNLGPVEWYEEVPAAKEDPE